MMQIECPFCGRRDETEFNYGGEAHLTRPTLDVNDEGWTQYLFFRNNVKGVHAERWRHTRGCGQWFNAVRNTATHEFMATYRITEPRPAIAPEPQLVSAGAPGGDRSGVPDPVVALGEAESHTRSSTSQPSDAAATGSR